MAATLCILVLMVVAASCLYEAFVYMAVLFIVLAVVCFVLMVVAGMLMAHAGYNV